MKKKEYTLRELDLQKIINENPFSKRSFILKDLSGANVNANTSNLNSNYPDGIKELFKYLGIE